MYIFSARALASCRRRPLSSNVRQHKAAVQYPSRKCACRRELNSHDAAEPRRVRDLSLRRNRSSSNEDGSEQACRLQRAAKHGAGTGAASQPAQRQRTDVPHRTSDLRWRHRFSVGSSSRRSQRCQPRLGRVSQRLECVVPHGPQRGAGSLGCGPREVTGLGQARRPRSPCAVLPNPSLKGSTNGRPPAPGRRYAVHCLRPGAGVLPLAPP